MSKNTKIISLSVPHSMHAAMDKVAEDRGYEGNVSKLSRDLINDFLMLDKRTYNTLRSASERRGVQVYELIEFLVDRFPLEDDTVKPIVLKIPVGVTKYRETLETWLLQKSMALVNHLHPENANC